MGKVDHKSAGQVNGSCLLHERVAGPVAARLWPGSCWPSAVVRRLLARSSSGL